MDFKKIQLLVKIFELNFQMDLIIIIIIVIIFIIVIIYIIRFQN